MTIGFYSFTVICVIKPLKSDSVEAEISKCLLGIFLVIGPYRSNILRHTLLRSFAVNVNFLP